MSSSNRLDGLRRDVLWRFRRAKSGNQGRAAPHGENVWGTGSQPSDFLCGASEGTRTPDLL